MRKISLLAAAVAATLSVAHAAEGAKIVLPAGVSAPSGYQLLADYGSFALYRGNPAAMPRGVAGAQVLAEADLLQFDRLRIDTQTSSIIAPPGFSLNAPIGAALHLVQFIGPLKDAWLDEVRATGAVPVHYIESNGYLVWADAAARGALGNLAAQRTTLQFSEPLPSFVKLGDSLFARLQGSQATAAGTLIPITVQMYRHAGGAATKQALAAIGLKPVVDWNPILGYESARYEATLEQVRQIIEQPDVYWVGEVHPRRLNDEVQAQIIRGYFNAGQTGPQAEGYLPWLEALGFSTNPADYPILDITDDGIGNRTTTTGDPTLHALGNIANASRVVFNQHCGSAATNSTVRGHGHINANIAGGYDVRTNATTPGARFPGNYQRGQGMNPWARLGGTRIFNSSNAFDQSTCGNTDMGVISASYVAGARISSNSWGCSGCASQYDDSSQAYDAGTRDANPAAAGNQELITVFSAGNSGSGAGTVGTPGNGKNMITVGASENQRPVDENGNWTDGCATGPTGADNAMDIIAFSSRGPSPGQRTKPEVIAPGTHITGTQATPSTGGNVCDSSRPTGNATYAASSGTSHSAPAVAGVTSLAWWWIANGQGALTFEGGSPSAPSPALMKAYLIAHPTYLTGASGNGNLPTNAQGYGMPNLEAMFSDTPTHIVNQTQVLGATGETWEWIGAAVDPAKPVRIALVWTDAAGAIGTSPQVNNLDLKVEYGSSTYLGNVFTGRWSTTGGAADIRNNYEAVFLQPGSPDSIKITVTGFNISGDGVPGNADTTDQDFAIVCSNCAQNPTFTLAVDPAALSVCTQDAASVPFNISTGSILGFTTPANLSVSGAPAGTSTAFSVNPVPLPGNSVLTVGNLGAAAAGTSTLTITGTAGAEVKSREAALTLFTADPAAFTLSTPASGAQNVALSPVLAWAASAQAADYFVEVATDAAFTNVVWSGTTTAPTVTVGTALNSAATYYWRVTAGNECGDTAVSEAFSFTTIPLPGDCPVGVTPTDVYTTDFEGDNSAWTATAAAGTANWAISNARTHSGTNAFLAQNVAAISDQLLTSPAITLPADQAPLALLFWNHQTIEDQSATACYDGALLQISTDGGTTWTQVPDALLQVGPYKGPISSSFSNPAGGSRAWCGDPQDWTRYVVNLDTYAGQTVQFRFRMATDSSVGRVPDGFYLDDLKVQACGEGGTPTDLIFADGFEDGTVVTEILVDEYTGRAITDPAGGPGGAPASALQTTLSMTTIGAGAQTASGNSVAEDFTVPASGWSISKATFHTYQTGSGTTSTINDVRVQIFSGTPTGTPVFGDTTTNRLTSTAWNGAYRVTQSNMTDASRPLYEVVAEFDPPITLAAGTYWIAWSMGGSGASGPWALPQTVVGQSSTGNCQQATTASAGVFQPLMDGGSLTPIGCTFVLEGTAP